MTDAWEATSRMVASLDQQIAACRDANGRLTARMVQLEAELKRVNGDLDYYRDTLGATEHLLEVTSKALREVQALSDQYLAQLRSREAEIDRLWGSIMRGEL